MNNKTPINAGASNSGVNGNVIRHDPNATVAQIVEQPQTQVITRQPLVTGNILRTVTQGKVRSVKETGMIEEQNVQMVTVSENSQQVKSNTPQTAAAAKDTKEKKEDDNSTWLSAGSILTGTLINGIDAPTSGGQQQRCQCRFSCA